MFLVIAGQRHKDQKELCPAPLYKIMTIHLYLVRNAQLYEMKYTCCHHIHTFMLRKT